MSFVDSALWAQIKKNEKLYLLIHNSVGNWLTQSALKDKENRLNKYGLETIFEIDGALKSTGIVYYVDFGTLLGFIREGHLLTWDDDIDFGIHLTAQFTWNDLEKLLNHHGFVLVKQFQYNAIITEQTYCRDGVYIDFFNHFTDGTVSRYYFYYKKTDYEYENDNILHARVTSTCKIDNNRAMEIESGIIHVPSSPENYLKDVYGSNWRVPNKNWSPNSMDNIEWLNEFGHMEIFEH